MALHLALVILIMLIRKLVAGTTSSATAESTDIKPTEILSLEQTKDGTKNVLDKMPPETNETVIDSISSDVKTLYLLMS